jgi:hypothetical protein
VKNDGGMMWYKWERKHYSGMMVSRKENGLMSTSFIPFVGIYSPKQ